MKHPLDSRQLLAFLTVVRRQSFTLAAQELHLTQSAVSHSMRALETDLGCRLLERSGRRIQLTEQGGVFLERAERILFEMEQARSDLVSLVQAPGVVTAA
jgi:DNA-binding transcriptional LysR family regulator